MKLACQDKLQLIIKLELNQLSADITTSPDGLGCVANSAQHI